MRGLSWLLEKWEKSIFPNCENAKLIIFSSNFVIRKSKQCVQRVPKSAGRAEGRKDRPELPPTRSGRLDGI